MAAARPSQGSDPGWAHDLIQPLPMAAVLLLALNDHLLKGAGLLPGWLTGKLSDLAGLFFFPLLLAALVRGASLALGRRGQRHARASSTPSTKRARLRLTGAAALLTAAVFAAIKLSPPVNAWASSLWGPMRLDPTDLCALPMAGLSVLWLRRRLARPAPAPARPASAFVARARRALQAAGVLAAALASMATSAVPRPTPQPPPEPDPPCARIQMLECSSEGHRVTALVQVVAERAPVCRLEVTEAAELHDDDAGQLQTRSGSDALPPPLVVRRDVPQTFTVTWSRPFPVPPRREPVVLEVHGLQWSGWNDGPERSLPPDWKGTGRVEGICQPAGPPQQVAQ